MNDSDKASYGLTPMTILPDPILHANGFYADTPDTVAVRLKWKKCPYPHIYRQAVYAWRGKPSWYSGNILYPIVDGSDLTTTMRQTAEKAEFVDAGAVKHTLTGLARGEEYYFCVQAQADQEGGFLTDVYITKLVADYDPLTPMVTNVTPHLNVITVDWRAYAGYGFAGYSLYVWTGRQTWYDGDRWYNVREDDELARWMGESAASFKITDGTVYSLDVPCIDGASTYYFGVIALLSTEKGYTDIYIVKKNVLDTWIWVPRGEVSQSIDWGTNVIDFETGRKQYQQKFTKPVRTFSATFSGIAKTWYEIRDFIDAHKGNLLPFRLWVDEYDRKTCYVVRFGDSKFNPKFQNEIAGDRMFSGLARHHHVGFTVDLTFIEAKDFESLALKPVEDDTTPQEEDDTVAVTELYVPVYKMAYTKLKDTTVEVGGAQPARITFVTRDDSARKGWSWGDHLAHNENTFLKQTNTRVAVSELKQYSPMDYELDDEGNKFAIEANGSVTRNGVEIANFSDTAVSYLSGEGVTFVNGIAYNSAFIDHAGNWYVIFTAATSDYDDENWDPYSGDENDYVPVASNRDMIVIHNGTPTMLWRRVMSSYFSGEVEHFVLPSSYEPFWLPCKNGYFFTFMLPSLTGDVFQDTTDNYYTVVYFYDADKNYLFSISHDDLMNAMWWCSARKTLSAYWKPYLMAFYEEIYSVLFNTSEACPMDWQSTFSLLKVNETAYLILINQNVNGNRDILSTDSVYAVEHAGDYNILLLWDNGTLTCLGLNLSQNNIKFISDPQAFRDATLGTF